ncbi:MAG TPA: S8 family serine peptidase [Candidatus Angelobacter sp.]
MAGWKTHFGRVCGTVAYALSMALGAAGQAQLAPEANEFDWRFSVKPNQVVSSNITAENKCRRRNRFEVDTQHLPSFMRLVGDSGFSVESHKTHSLPVQFDSTGLAAGKYEGEVVIRCVTCLQNGCEQDRQLLHIFMTVEGGNAAQSFVPERVLVLIPLDSPGNAEDNAKKLAGKHGIQMVEIHPLPSINAALVVYALPAGADVETKAAELLPEVLLAQPDYLYRTSGNAGQEVESGSLKQLQYGPKLIHADHLRGVVTGKGVRVAIIDSGIDVNHPALQGKISEQYDATGKGFTPDIHGTLIAGIVLSEPRTSGGILGISPGAEVVAIKACHPETPQTIEAQCTSSTLAKAMEFAVQKRSRIINLSLTGPAEKLLRLLIDAAVKLGIVVIAAAGNNGPRGQPSFPAALLNVIAVTAVDANEQLYAEATQGDFISVAAPGVDIVSTSPGSKLMVSSGTSFATAFVTGTAALLLEQQSTLSPAQLKSVLEHSARDLGPPGKDPQFGNGLVDACRAVAQVRSDPQMCR